MRNKRIRRISLVLVPVLLAMTIAPVSAAGGYPQRVRTVGWFGGVSQWVQNLYASFGGFRPVAKSFSVNRTTGAQASAATASSSTTTLSGESGSNCKLSGESGSNLSGESGSNITTRR